MKSFWYDASLTGEDPNASAVPAYFVEVAGTNPQDRQTVVVNANDSKVLKVLDGVTRQQKPATVKAATTGRDNRVICDANHKVVQFDLDHFGEMFSCSAGSRTGPGADRVDGEHFTGPDDQPFADSLIVGKTAYLITDGDTFNGQDVHGIGEDKAVALLWGVQNSLTETADFRDLGVALNTVCANNVKTGVAGTTASDCDQVAKAVTATQLLPGSGS